MNWYLLFWHGNPWAAAFLHGSALFAGVAVWRTRVRERAVDYGPAIQPHLHFVRLDSSEVRYDEATDTLEVHCSFPGCAYWGAPEEFDYDGNDSRPTARASKETGL